MTRFRTDSPFEFSGVRGINTSTLFRRLLSRDNWRGDVCDGRLTSRLDARLIRDCGGFGLLMIGI